MDAKSRASPKEDWKGELCTWLCTWFQYIVARGLFYVNWSRLNKPDEAIYYGELEQHPFRAYHFTDLCIAATEGPGLYSGRKGRLGVKGKYGLNMKRTDRLSVAESNNAVASSRRGRRGGDYSEDKAK